MPEEFLYAAMLASFGAVSGLDVLDKREFSSLNTSSLSRLLANVLGIADIALMGLAFFVFPFVGALGVCVAGAVFTAILAKAFPAEMRFWASYGLALLGFCAAIALLLS